VLLTAALLPLFLSLGLWQWNRGQARQQDWDQFARADLPAAEVPAARLAEMPRYARVRVRGHLDGTRQFLLDNMSHRGAPGYQVLTVLELEEGSRLLVNRGWVPFGGFREQLPDVALPAGTDGTRVELTGRLAGLPSVGLASGRLAPAQDGRWPRVTSFPTMEQLADAYGERLLPVVLLLDADSGPGFLREWHPPGLPPERHVGYAVQWWAFALLLVGLFVGLNLKKRND
jgi:surfeit locus 1 family protein